MTGDTLAMHLSLALAKRTVVLFGPTSAAEIDLYGLGEKIVPDMECLSCYKTNCDFVPNCMDLISVDMVEQAVLRQLTLSGSNAEKSCSGSPQPEGAGPTAADLRRKTHVLRLRTG